MLWVTLRFNIIGDDVDFESSLVSMRILKHSAQDIDLNPYDAGCKGPCMKTPIAVNARVRSDS